MPKYVIYHAADGWAESHQDDFEATDDETAIKTAKEMFPKRHIRRIMRIVM